MLTESEHQYRVRNDAPMPADWPWEDDLDEVRAEAEVQAAIGFTGVYIEARLRPQDDCCGTDLEVTWRVPVNAR